MIYLYLWIIAAILAYLIKGLCGFANTLVFTSVLSFSKSNADISPIDLLLGYPSNIILTFKNRKSLNPKIFLPLAALVLIGNIPGAVILRNVNTYAVKTIFGFVVVFLGTEMFMREFKTKNSPSSKYVLGIIGILSGILCGMFGVGALLAAYIGRVTKSDSTFKANISAVFIIENTFRIFLYYALNLLTFNTVKAVIPLIPFAFLSLFAGIKISSKLNEKTVRKTTSVLIIISGIFLIFKNIIMFI